MYAWKTTIIAYTDMYLYPYISYNGLYTCACLIGVAYISVYNALLITAIMCMILLHYIYVYSTTDTDTDHYMIMCQ